MESDNCENRTNSAVSPSSSSSSSSTHQPGFQDSNSENYQTLQMNKELSTHINIPIEDELKDEQQQQQSQRDSTCNSIVTDISGLRINDECTNIGKRLDTTDDGSSSSSSSVCDISKSSQATGIVRNPISIKKFLPLYVPSTLPKHIRNLPKTQSLDLSDERTDDSIILTESKSSDISSCNSLITPKLQSLDQSVRPIYPNVPYSPYGSPYGSPRSGRRRPPLRESRRISIEQTGSFLQLNQYKLMDQIGQVSQFSVQAHNK